MRFLTYTIFVFFLCLLSCRPSCPSTPNSIEAVGYKEVIAKLEAAIISEVTNKDLPALSIALVDSGKIVYAKGFGFQDAEKKIPADIHTIYKTGSLAEMFTRIAIMQERNWGKLRLDEDIQSYLPEFAPKNPFGEKITIYQLLTHTSGLPREPPVGHFSDETEPSLKETVESLNTTELLFKPGERTKYSAAGTAVLGYLLEKLTGEPFALNMQKRFPDFLDMPHTSFGLNEHIQSHLADGTMWTYDGRAFPAPTFELGMAPAGNMYASVEDLAKFMQILLAKGKTPEGIEILDEGTLEDMWRSHNDKGRFGFLRDNLGRKEILRSSGSTYGFTTEISMLPEDQLGVVITTSKDFMFPFVQAIRQYVLYLALEKREGKELSDWSYREPVGKEIAKQMAGRYIFQGNYLELVAKGEQLYAEEKNFNWKLNRDKKEGFILYDHMTFSNTFEPIEEGSIKLNRKVLNRIDVKKPAPLISEQKVYIGEYGKDYKVLYILERFSELHALVNGCFKYPINSIGKDQFKFPESRYDLYPGENLKFERDDLGKITGVWLGEVFYERRLTNIEDGKTFQIEPIRPTDELREIALKATPPQEEGEFNASDLVDLSNLDPSIKYDIRYASDNNFMGIPFYQQSKAFMQRPAAEAVVRIHQRLKEKGYGLVIHDAYRPWYVTKMFWDATPEESKHFVANPENGSRHNRGCAVDLTLYELETGKVVEMVGGYDEMSPRSYPDYPGGTDLQRYYRELLREAMEADGFTVYQWEWWHFDYKDWKSYRIQNLRFEELE